MQTYLILFCKNIWEKILDYFIFLQNEFSKPAPMKSRKSNAGLLVLSKLTFVAKKPRKNKCKFT